ncbi:MAG: DUF4468 domain-containing protein [Mucilaginibacter sp.]
MKTLIIALVLSFISHFTFAGNSKSTCSITYAFDTVKLKVDSDRNVYYQNTVNVKGITVDMIYTRAVQFMAAKNIQLNYGYQEDGKLIFTTTQDININRNYADDDNDQVIPYTAQFSITLDLKNGAYRYTINNIVFFFPTQTGNKRETIYDVLVKATYVDSKRIARNGKTMISAFERYLETLTGELRAGIEQKATMYNKF